MSENERETVIDPESVRLLNDYAETEAEAAPAAEAQPELSTRALATLFCSLYVGVFLCALDGTVIVTLMAHISSEFHEFRSVSWIASAYLISLATFQPLYGKISDIYGRRAMLLFSNGAFAVGCVMCGMAPNIWFLVFARVIAGIGGGGLNSLTVITMSDLVPLRQRGLLQGFGSLLYNTGAAVGGVFGGLLTEWLGWRWAFYIQVPFVVVSALAVWYNLKPKPYNEIETSRLKRIDFAGSLSLVSFLSVFLLALSLGGSYVPWSHPIIFVLFPLSFALLAVFVHIETKVAVEPVLPLSLLKDRTVLGSSFTNAFVMMACYSHLFYVPIYFVAVRGISATAAGSKIIPNFIGTGIGAIATGSYMKMTGKYYRVMLTGSVLMFVGACLVSTYGLDTPSVLQILYLFVPGIGLGALITSTLIALIASVPHEFQAVTTSIQYGFRGTGSTIGVSMASAIFQNVLSAKLWERLGDLPNAADIITLVQDSVEEVTVLPEAYRPLVIQSYLDACHGVFLFAAVLSFLIIVFCSIMKEHPLNTTLRR
ncbi:major facilitator superfamily domain-containing protein [Dipodascopsis tothii]|uniref:major facilitator superfamily domain-containing protein n=1 Tax=Dipodascopsis tothii TaxID=44089 RepID=UPI0034CD1721